MLKKRIRGEQTYHPPNSRYGGRSEGSSAAHGPDFPLSDKAVYQDLAYIRGVRGSALVANSLCPG